MSDTVDHALCVQGSKEGEWHFVQSSVAVLGYRWAERNEFPFDAKNSWECRLIKWTIDDTETWFRLVHVKIVDKHHNTRSEVRALVCDDKGKPKEKSLRHVHIVSLKKYPDLTKGRTTGSADVSSWE